MDAEGNAVVGITQYASEQLGDIVFVELPKVGKELKAGEASAVIESTKAASDIYAPVSGMMLEGNSEVVDAPELINSAPETNWLYKMKLDSASLPDGLLSEEEYNTFTSEQ